MQGGILAGFRPAGVDDDELRAALSPPRLAALVDDRMAPGGVRSAKDDQVRLINVGIGSGHHILAKGADVSCDRARPPRSGEPRVGHECCRTLTSPSSLRKTR